MYYVCYEFYECSIAIANFSRAAETESYTAHYTAVYIYVASLNVFFESSGNATRNLIVEYSEKCTTEQT
jgi:hypothetical protein